MFIIYFVFLESTLTWSPGGKGDSSTQADKPGTANQPTGRSEACQCEGGTTTMKALITTFYTTSFSAEPILLFHRYT